MDFFANFSRKKRYAESVVLIDIGMDSIAGAYARFAEDETPILLFALRLSIEIRENESRERAMSRTLEMLGNELIREGAPILMRASGSGSAAAILVSIDAQWEEIKMRTEKLERENPFIFTKSIVDTVLKNTSIFPSGKIIANESIMDTVLNGYETSEPYGKKIRRASFAVLTSFVNKNISESVVATLRGLYHTEHIFLIAGKSLRYQAMRAAFPHEHDALIIDAFSPTTSIALIHKNVLVKLAEMSELHELTKRYSFLRVIFLLARESEISSLQKSFAAMPSKIVPVAASHISGLVKQTTPAPPDLQLLLMALYYQHCSFKKMIYLTYAHT